MKYTSLIFIFIASLWMPVFAQDNNVWNKTALGAAPATDDRLFLYDTSATTSKTMTIANLFSSPTVTTPRFTDLGYLADSNGNELIIFDLTASAVNEITIGNAATGGSPFIKATGGDTNVSLPIDAKGSGTLTLNGTATGNIILGRAATTSFTITQTSASATAFESGLNGGTNPVFRLVNNIANQATGISITGRAAAAGADLTVLSSGTNESMCLNAKGSGTVLVNETATGAFLVADATNPAFSVVHTTEGTGVSVTSAAAGSGVAVAAISSGTNESVTFDAKGSGTITLNGTGTGSVRSGTGFLYKDLTEVVAATNVITAAESGSVFYLSSATEFVSTLPAPAAGLHFTFIVTAAPSGASYTVVTNSSSNIIKGLQNSVAGDAGDSGTADDTISFVDGQAVAGDKVEVFCDGTNWFAYAVSKLAAGVTFTQAN